MTQNPVTYAESNLQVNQVWIDARKRYDNLLEASDRLVEANAAIREVKEKLAHRERELVAVFRATYNELSETAFTRKSKELLHDDPIGKKLRSELRECEHTQDRAEQDVRYNTQGCHLLAARMNELAGLLNFYAACKVNP